MRARSRIWPRPLRALARACLVALCLITIPVPAQAATQADPQKQQVFLESLDRIAAGDYQAAIRLLRRLLRDDPQLHRVRLELARAYFLAREWERARREFFTVLSADIPPQVRANIIAFLREIDARRGWDWGLNFAVLPGGGLTRDYRSDTVTLDIAGQELDFKIEREEEPDFGVEYGGYLEFRGTLSEGDGATPKVTAGLRAALAARDFEGSDFDDYRLRLDAPLTLSFPERTLVLDPFGSRRWYAGDAYEDEIGLAAQFDDRSLQKWTLSLGGSLGWVDNLDDPSLDGLRYGVNAGAFRSLGSTAIAGATLGLLRFDADAPHESFREVRTGLVLSADLGRGITGTARPSLAWRDYDATAPLFAETRHDWEASVAVQFTKSDFTVLGFSPFIGYEFAWHDSNIGLHRYTDHILRTGFTKTF